LSEGRESKKERVVDQYESINQLSFTCRAAIVAAFTPVPGGSAGGASGGAAADGSPRAGSFGPPVALPEEEEEEAAASPLLSPSAIRNRSEVFLFFSFFACSVVGM
jgi:hypothetical protein